MPSRPSVQVTNLAREAGGKDFKDKYDGEVYIIKTGGSAFVPWEAACRWLGDPNLVDDTNDKSRRNEYNRLSVKYGVYENEELWEANRPTISVYSMDGDRITMLLDDPEGDEILVAEQTIRESQQMEDRLQQMEREMVALRRRLRAKGDTAPEPDQDTPVGGRPEPRIGTLGDNDGEAEEDRPSRVPVEG